MEGSAAKAEMGWRWIRALARGPSMTLDTAGESKNLLLDLKIRKSALPYVERWTSAF